MTDAVVEQYVFRYGSLGSSVGDDPNEIVARLNSEEHGVSDVVRSAVAVTLSAS